MLPIMPSTKIAQKVLLRQGKKIVNPAYKPLVHTPYATWMFFIMPSTKVYKYRSAELNVNQSLK